MDITYVRHIAERNIIATIGPTVHTTTTGNPSPHIKGLVQSNICTRPFFIPDPKSKALFIPCTLCDEKLCQYYIRTPTSFNTSLTSIKMTKHLFLTILIILAYSSVHAKTTTILFLGDSLTAGYGVASEQAYPSLIEKKLKHDYPVTTQVINGSISGSTSASALSRLHWYQQKQPEILFLALGANDGLRGLAVKQLAANLERVVTTAHQNGMTIILAGMQMPPNYGIEYTDSFRQVYPRIAGEFHLLFIPFLLEGVAGRTEFNQADGIHPNPKGHQHIARLVYPYIKKALQHNSSAPMAPTASQAIHQ